MGARVNGRREWETPERNAAGEIIGWVRRVEGRGGKANKIATKGSKRGLTFVAPLDIYAGTSVNEPLYIVEGATCTAAGLSVGLDVVGRYSACGVTYLPELLAGRHVCIIGENDGGAGRAGAQRTAAALLDSCATVKIIYPPAEITGHHIKDLRDWINAGVTADSIHAAARVAEPVGPGAQLSRPSTSKIKSQVWEQSADEVQDDIDAQSEKALAAMPADVRGEAECMLANPKLIDQVLADLEVLGVVGEQELAATSYLIGTSRLLTKPLAGIVQGLSGTGKTYVPLTASKLFPPEAIVNATDITTNALYYLPAGALVHRWVVAGEQRRGEDDEHADARKALREMLESGYLSKMVTLRRGQRMEAALIQQPGPIAYTESTTKVRLFDEDANRCLLLGTDESEEQTRRIVLAQAARAAGKKMDAAPVVARHHAVQRLLRRVRVIIPFAESLAAAVPTERAEARRAMPHMLAMIEAVAVLHQRQRAGGDLRHGDTITATEMDYVIARRLLVGPLGRALGGAIPDAVARFGGRLTARYGSQIFTPSDVLQEDQVLTSKGKVSEYLRALEGAGSVQCVEESRGNKPARWRVVGQVPIGGALWLPTVEAMRGAQP
jgi:hypothetical protein